MAQLTGGSAGAIRLDQISAASLRDASIQTQTGTQYRLDLGGGLLWTFTGTGFQYDANGDPTAGTISQIAVTLNGSQVYGITGLTTSAPQFWSFIQSGDTAGALQFIFVGPDNMQGTAGADYLEGHTSHDNLFGGDGADTLIGGTGNDHLYGQSANGGADGADNISAGDGSDYLQGNAGNDLLDGGAGSDRIQGGQGDDSAIGGGGNDSINGNLGNDTIEGGDANDSLRGGQGNDRLLGGTGNDILLGDLGVDTLSGGTNIDYFLFGTTSSLFAGSSADVITDFENGLDRIGVGYTVSALLTGPAQASFSAAATAAQALFDGNAGNAEVAAVAVGNDTYLFFSSDGGGSANSAVMLSGRSASDIDIGDFI